MYWILCRTDLRTVYLETVQVFECYLFSDQREHCCFIYLTERDWIQPGTRLHYGLTVWRAQRMTLTLQNKHNQRKALGTVSFWNWFIIPYVPINNNSYMAAYIIPHFSRRWNNDYTLSSDPVISLPLNRLSLVDITNPFKGFIIMNLCQTDMAPLLVA